MLSGDNSILQKTTDVKQTTERSNAKEQAQMDIIEWIADKTANHQNTSLDDSRVKTILTGKAYVKEAKDTSFITAKGEYEIPYSELYTASDTTPMATIPAGTYTAGQEVTFGEEQFFVIADDGDSVRLLTKYCLNRVGTMQVDKNVKYSDYTLGDNTIEGYGRRFSETNYWISDYTNSPFDLQTEAMITKATADGTTTDPNGNTIKNAVLAAKSYGESKGVTGRLMTYTEANDIQNGSDSNMKNILWGRWSGEDAPSTYLCWWLGAAYRSDSYFDSDKNNYMWRIDGTSSSLKYSTYNHWMYGVRPVLIVPEG